jgi:hypothetical protein
VLLYNGISKRYDVTTRKGVIMTAKELDPLDELVVKYEEVEGENRKLLAKILIPHVQIDPDKGTIYFVKQPSNLKTKEQVLLVLLAKLALAQKNPDITPNTTSKEVEEISGLPGGTVRPKIAELIKEKVIAKSSVGYYIEAKNLYKARAILENTTS